MRSFTNEQKSTLYTTSLKGLSEEEVIASRNQFGVNQLTSKKRAGFWSSFAHSFGDPMIKILLAALAINIIFLAQNSNWFESVGIALAILLATLVSTISEYGSESAFEKLQEEASKTRCRVQRVNGLQELPVEEVVVGDLVLLQPGERIPADGYMVKGQLEVDQSALNGESKEAKKYPEGRRIEKTPKQDFLSPHLLFSGTIVCSGEGMMCVNSVGDQTYYGKIGAEIQEETRESPLRHRLSGLAAGIGKFGYIAAIFSALAFLFNNLFIDNGFNLEVVKSAVTSWETMFPLLIQACTLGVTVVVMAVPEGLPMMITVVLSANMKRMIKDHVLVRKLIGIETAGSMNILFTDKTGTLTQGKLSVSEFANGSGRIWDRKELMHSPLPLHGILKDCLRYNSSAALEDEKAIGGNATDRATLEFAKGLNGGYAGLQSITTLPFTSENKLMMSQVRGEWNATFIKGAPEKILPHCTSYYEESGRTLSFTSRFKIERLLKAYTQKSMRVIVVAVSDSAMCTPYSLKNLTLVGILAIRDDLRLKTRSGVQQVQQAGIQTVMITGDSKDTATAIAREVGLLRSDRDLIVTHDEMANMDDQALMAMLPKIRVVARASPSDKSRLVRVAQAMNLVVGMTGDGVNDAPALKQADIGFSMGSGTEVAKEAGDIVILDNRFDSIAKAVCYGRTIFNSIRKFIIYQMSICLCAVGVTVIGPLINVDFPITVIQMLWINIVMDTLAGLAFSGERARLEYMKEAPKRRDEPIINGYMKSQIAVSSLYSIVICLWFLKSRFFHQMVGGYGEVYGLTLFFELFMFCAIFNSFNARTSKMNLFSHLSSNTSFLWLMGAIALVQILIPFLGGPVFRTVPIRMQDMMAILLLAFSVIPVDLMRKLFTGATSVSSSAAAFRPASRKQLMPIRKI